MMGIVAMYGAGAAAWLAISWTWVSVAVEVGDVDRRTHASGPADATDYRVGFTVAAVAWPAALVCLAATVIGKRIGEARLRRFREAEERKRWLEASVEEVVRGRRP